MFRINECRTPPCFCTCATAERERRSRTFGTENPIMRPFETHQHRARGRVRMSRGTAQLSFLPVRRFITASPKRDCNDSITIPNPSTFHPFTSCFFINVIIIIALKDVWPTCLSSFLVDVFIYLFVTSTSSPVSFTLKLNVLNPPASVKLFHRTQSSETPPHRLWSVDADHLSLYHE